MTGRQFSLIAQMPPVSLLAPAADAAGRTSAYRSLKDALKAFVVVEVNQGNAATVLLSLLQAKDAAGTSSKAVNACPINTNIDTVAAGDFAAQTAAATFTTDAALKNKLIVFDVTPDAALDVNNGFCYLGLSTGASNAANITRAELIIVHGTQQAVVPDTYL